MSVNTLFLLYVHQSVQWIENFLSIKFEGLGKNMSLPTCT